MTNNYSHLFSSEPSLSGQLAHIQFTGMPISVATIATLLPFVRASLDKLKKLFESNPFYGAVSNIKNDNEDETTTWFHPLGQTGYFVTLSLPQGVSYDLGFYVEKGLLEYELSVHIYSKGSDNLLYVTNLESTNQPDIEKLERQIFNFLDTTLSY